jgi:thioredoxin-related protein
MVRSAIFLTLIIVGMTKGYSQTDTLKGVDFVHDLSWQQILQKAKAENRYVFVDCFATWCGPCKRMDKNVYPVDSVGEFMNQRFISVKIQMDTAKQDDDEVKKWYASAHQIIEDYHVANYPTYLFFSPEGKAVHKRIGEINAGDFLAMAREATDSNQQYYTLLHNYRNGERNYALMPTLAIAAERVGNYIASSQVREDYVHNYLDKLPEGVTWTRENVVLITRFSNFMKCNDRIFQFYYQNRLAIDSVMKEPDFADDVINSIIYTDLIAPYLDSIVHKGVKAHWPRLRRGLERSYDVYYVHKNVLHGQIEYYKARKEWRVYMKYFIEQKEESGLERGEINGVKRLDLNNAAYEVFLYGNNRQLRKALSWVDLALSPKFAYVDAMDTKANILYKLGRKQEGLDLEEQAYALVSKASRSYADIQANYEKMKKGLHTWIYN